MAMTLLFREMFATTGTLTSGAPGSNFSSVTGTLYQRAGGPRLSAGAAASADIRGAQASGKFTLSNPAKMMAGAWYFIKAQALGGAGQWRILYVEDAFSNSGPTLAITSGVLGAGQDGGTRTALPIDPVNQWVWLAVAVSRTAGTTADVRYYYKTVGGALTSFAPANAINIGIGTTGAVRFGLHGANANIIHRIGAMSAYSFAQSDFSDVAYPSDVIEPVTGLTWYVNPSTGSDSNDGTAAGSAWQTVDKLNTESQYTGLFSATSYAAGDTLVIDTSAASLDLTGAALTLQTRGLNVRPATGQTYIACVPYKTLSAGGWSTTGTANVYSTTDTVAKACVWEDDKWLTHVPGANFAAVSATLGSTAGSFFTDGTTLYVHPFANTDPRSDGKVYTRSHTGISAAAVNLNAGDMNVSGFFVTKTCDVAQADSSPNAGYSIGTGGSWAGTNRIANCLLTYSGKHGLGLVANSASNEVTTIDTCQSEQGSPYGSQSPFVSYNSNASTPTGIQHIYTGCISLKNAGLIGSTAGQQLSTNSVLLSHNNGTGVQFSNITVTGCNFSGGNVALSVNASSTIRQSTIGSITVNDPACAITRCLIDRAGISQSYTTAPVLIVRNCILTPVAAGASYYSGTRGTSTWEGNTWDLRGVTGSDTQVGLLQRLAASTVTFRNNAVWVDPTKSHTVFQAYVNTDTLTVDYNVYRLGKNTEVAFQYNDGSTTAVRTFTQWRTLGFDAHSQSVSSLTVDASYRPTAGSALINAGIDLGPLEDYTGTVFATRNDVGAYEFPVLTIYAYLHRQRRA